MNGGNQLVYSGAGSVDGGGGRHPDGDSDCNRYDHYQNGRRQQAGEVDQMALNLLGGGQRHHEWIGARILSSGGTAPIGTMNSGSQDINSGAVGTADQFQRRIPVESGATGTISTMYGGSQIVTHGVGRIDSAGNGTQFINGGTGTITYGTNAIQINGASVQHWYSGWR